MKTLKQMFGHTDKFFDLLEASANEARSSVKLLVDVMKSPVSAMSLDEFVHARRKDKRITEEITEELCRTFVTPMEREDIEELSIALYKIPKTVEKFSERYLICSRHLQGYDFSRQLRVLEEATDTVAAMVGSLRGHAGLSAVKEQNDRLHCLEREADRAVLDFVKDLYGGQHDPLKVIMLTDLCETLERIVDRCRDAGNVVFHVVLKYS